jgi:hypothetical protein
MSDSEWRVDPWWSLLAQRALHDRTRVAFEAAAQSGIDGRFHVSETHGLLVVLTTAQGLGFLNTITITDDASLPELPEILGQFRSAGIDDPTVIAPDDDPARAGRLDDLGLRPAATRPFAFTDLKSAASGSGAADSGRVRVGPVKTPEDRARFLDVLLDGYDGSPEVERFIRAEHSSVAVDAYLAWIDDEPVAGAAMSWHEDGLVLGGAATLAPHRGSGAQTALLRAFQADLATRDLARSSGAMLAAATAAPDSTSLRNMQRAGFAIHPRRAWRSGPSE